MTIGLLTSTDALGGYDPHKTDEAVGRVKKCGVHEERAIKLGLQQAESMLNIRVCSVGLALSPRYPASLTG